MGTSIVSMGMSIVWTVGQVSRYSRHKAACTSATQAAGGLIRLEAVPTDEVLVSRGLTCTLLRTALWNLQVCYAATSTS